MNRMPCRSSIPTTVQLHCTAPAQGVLNQGKLCNDAANMTGSLNWSYALKIFDNSEDVILDKTQIAKTHQINSTGRFLASRFVPRSPNSNHLKLLIPHVELNVSVCLADHHWNPSSISQEFATKAHDMKDVEFSQHLASTRYLLPHSNPKGGALPHQLLSETKSSSPAKCYHKQHSKLHTLQLHQNSTK